MDYIFKEWEKKLTALADSVEKDLKEIRKCKAEMQQLQIDTIAEIKKGQYVRDDQRLVLSAPEIIIGNVDSNGTLFEGGSTIIVRGTQVGVQAAGEAGQLEMQAASIRQIAEDPGSDGQEHVACSLSEVVSQARHIIIQSDEAQGAFSSLTVPTGGSGVRIHADKTIDIDAAATAESRETHLDAMITTMETQQKNLKEKAKSQKEGFSELVKEIEELLDKKEKLIEDEDAVRSNYLDVGELNAQIDDISKALSSETYAYAETLSLLAETNRRLKCFKDEKDSVVKGDDFKTKPTGTAVNIKGENISLISIDGEGNLRDNEGSGISLTANEVSVASVEADGKLKEKGKVRIQAKNVEVTTAGEADQQVDDEKGLTDAKYDAEGDFIVTSKNITLESIDYELAESKRKEKQLTADSKIKLRSKTIEVSTENVANVEVDEEGKLTKANYTAEGDIIIHSKTLTVESADYDVENGEAKEKALTADSQVSIRAEKMALSATDSEGKATGSVSINAKAVSVKSMDTDKESHADSALAEGSTMVLVSEKMFVGAKSKDVKSKKLQAVSEEMGLFADNTFEAQQGDGKAVVQLDGGNTAVGGSKTDVFGATTINDKTEVKGELKAPKISGDSIEAKSAFKSPNISDGMAAGVGGSGGSLSAKLKTEDAPQE